jgi:hypothetical protein
VCSGMGNLGGGYGLLLDVLVLRFGGGYAFYRLRTGDVGMVWGKKQPNGCGVHVGWILEVQRLCLLRSILYVAIMKHIHSLL